MIDDSTAKAAGYAEQVEQTRQLEMLLSLSRRVAALDSLDAVLDTLVAAATEEIGAERGSIFLHDDETGELYTYLGTGLESRQIRIMNDQGIAGAVYQRGVGEIVGDAYEDARFHREADRSTGFRTRSLLCGPIRNMKGVTIGVVEILNSTDGGFDEADLELLERMTSQCAITLESMQMLIRMTESRKRELEFMDVVSELTSELELGKLLDRVMSEARRMLGAERCTLFLNDEKTGELFSYLKQGGEDVTIRIPNSAGIAGAVFTSQQSVRIPYAYADLRFNPAIDRQTGFFTRSILCAPVFNKSGKVLGVTQALNKLGGTFTEEDESRLRAFTAQIAIGLENAKLFSDVQAMKNYNESVLQSMSNGVITFGEDGISRTCNGAALRIMRRFEGDAVGEPAAQIFAGGAEWVVERLERVGATGESEFAVDAELEFGGETVSANVSFLPLVTEEDAPLGTMVVIEDISNEKRVKSTLSRYMDPDLADRLLSADSQEEILGGTESVATVLFSDVRNFTPLAERLGAQGTVALLNSYFGQMVDSISVQGGMLDKFIGDAIMAAFGLPVAGDDDEDRALRTAIDMIRRVREWNGERERRGETPIEIGIGLHTDTVVAGNIGSPKRMDYTIIGDGVNLASRLEGACKQYGARIILSEATQSRLRGIYRLREIDRVIVKGKSKPVSIFESLDYHDELSYPNLTKAIGAFNEGIALYRAGEFEQASDWFSQVLAANPEDPVAATYVDRCRQLAQAPPPEGWDGVWVMSEK